MCYCSVVTVCKRSSAKWDALLPAIISAFGGSSERLEAGGMPLLTLAALALYAAAPPPESDDDAVAAAVACCVQT